MSDLTRKPSLPSRSPVSAGLSPSPLAAAGPSAAGGVAQQQQQHQLPPPAHPSSTSAAAAASSGVPPHAAVAGAPPQAAAYGQPSTGGAPGSLPSAAAFPAAASMTAVAPPPGSAPVSRGPYPISAFVLKMSGAYLGSVVGIWSTQDGRHGKTEKLGGSSIGFGHTSYRSLRNKGVPEGAFVRFGLEVALGKNCEDQTVFIYEEACVSSLSFVRTGADSSAVPPASAILHSSPCSAYYVASGTSLSSDKLHLVTLDE